ncbi:hypothetical protein Tco_1120187 [Tanacetum coccineum]
MTRSSNKELVTPYKEPERVLRSARKLFKTTSLDYLSSLEFDLFSDLGDQCEEEKRGDDEEVITDNELSKDENLIEENEIAQVFIIETNIFHFKTPLCKEFKEFNYLSQIDVDVLTKDIPGFKTYKEYKDD